MGWDYSALQPSSSSDDLLKSLIIALLILRIIWSSPYWSLIKNLHGSEVGPGVRWGREPPLRCQTQSLLCNSQCSINMQSICRYFAQPLLCKSQCAIREYVRSQCCPSMQSWALPWHPRHLTTALLHITMSANSGLFVEHYSSCSIRNMQSSTVQRDRWARAGGGCVVTGQLQLAGSSLARSTRRVATASPGWAQGKELPQPFSIRISAWISKNSAPLFMQLGAYDEWQLFYQNCMTSIRLLR